MSEPVERWECDCTQWGPNPEDDIAVRAKDYDALAQKLQVAVEALQDYGRHYDGCKVRWALGNCDCGYEDALKRMGEA